MREVRPILDELKDAYPGELRELKSSRLVNGIGAWRQVAADERKRLFLRLCGYPTSAATHAYTFVLDRQEYQASQNAGNLPVWAPTPWLASATALSMFIQRDHQGLSKNKGLTVLIFDDNKVELPKLSEFLIQSSQDVDSYYERPGRAEPFDQIIDTAFAIKSDHSRLVQISDACAFAIRRRAEIQIGADAEKWDGELDFFNDAVSAFASRVKFPTKTWVRRPYCHRRSEQGPNSSDLR